MCPALRIYICYQSFIFFPAGLTKSSSSLFAEISVPVLNDFFVALLNYYTPCQKKAVLLSGKPEKSTKLMTNASSKPYKT